MTSTVEMIARLRRRTIAFVALSAVAVGGAILVQDAPAQGFGIDSGGFTAKTHDPIMQPPPLTVFTGPDDAVWTSTVLNLPEVDTAGAHVEGSAVLRLNPYPGVTPARPWGNVRDILVDTPPGFVGNAQVVPPCPTEDFHANGRHTNCPPASQVGLLVAAISDYSGFVGGTMPIYNIHAHRGVPALFGFKTPAGQAYLLEPSLRADDNYSLRVSAANIPVIAPLLRSVATFWGVPHDPIHDIHRYNPQTEAYGTSLVGERPRPFLMNPTYCSDSPLTTFVSMRSWQEPGTWARASFDSATPPGECDRLEFGTASAPVSLVVNPTVHSASSPTGAVAKLRLPYNDNAGGQARPTLKDIEVALPDGMTVNPSAGDGLAGCAPGEVGLGTDEPVRCPAASKLGSVTVRTPLLAETLHGAVYQAMPYDNPFDSLLALYVVVENQERGIRVKLAGKVDADPATGQLTTAFENNPQLPFTELDMELKRGPRAPLATPAACGTHVTRATLTPWSHPHTGPPLLREDPIEVSTGVSGTSCADGGAARPFAPRLGAGTTNPIAGEFASFSTRFVREDHDQEIRRVGDVVVPDGLVAKVAGVPLCADDLADRGACSEAARIGRLQVAAGVGSSPLWVPQAGKAPTAVYLAGPYRGAPYSLSIVVPAQAGPFDLGTVVVRVALHIDRRTAQVTARVIESRHLGRDGSLEQVWQGEVPLMLEGIPLYQRDIRVIVDRDQFMLNPTSCREQQIRVSLGSAGGQAADVVSRFQVADCAALPFEPKLTMRLTGKKQIRTGRHPGIRAQVTQRPGESGIGKAKVTLPKSLALDVNNAQALCEFEDGTKPDLENHCPAGSIVGRAVARTPLLNRPLEGNVYFVKNVRRDPKTGNAIRTLPMVIAALRGEVAINLVGESETTKAGRLVNTFAQVPDAPVSKFNLNINGGKNGIIAVTRTRRSLINLCAKPKSHIAEADMDGHNGKRYDRDVRMTTPCSKRQVKKAQRAAKKRGR